MDEDPGAAFARLLSEARNLLLGVQILFAGLLLAPFSARFARLDLVEKSLYASTAAFTVSAAILLAAPGIIHRLARGRPPASATVRMGARLTRAGGILTGIALLGGSTMIGRLIFGTPGAVAGGVLAAVLEAVFWFGAAGVAGGRTGSREPTE